MTSSTPYEAETSGVLVRVWPSFLDEESSPARQRYMWAYRIEIENRSARTVQLRTRHWRITDRDGRVQVVDGEGVVGQQPVLKPGETFEYTSGAPLSEPSGVMQGVYRFEDGEGGVIDAVIPLFALDSPYDRRAPN
jgi:ApaG protein